MAKQYLTADEVVAQLGISKGTLYSYVSRGLIRSEEIGGKTRARRYMAADVQQLLQRKVQRRNPAQAATTALFFGDPVFESAITLITDGQLYYRGRNVLTLAKTYSFEQVALLLWQGAAISEREIAPVNGESFEGIAGLTQPIIAIIGELLEQGHVAEALQMALLTLAPQDLAAYQISPQTVAQTGLRLLRLLSALYAHAVAPSAIHEASEPDDTEQPSATITIAQTLQQCWAPEQPAFVPLLDAALILCADHELNASSFTARCVASTGATPYAAVIAALSALQGYKHGGSTHEVATLFREARHDPARAIRERLRLGNTIPGFGHRLYPEGDPRAKLLLQLAREEAQKRVDTEKGHATVFSVVEEIITYAAQATQMQPNLDFGLVALAQVLGLPDYAPFSLFALGRTAGWIGHMIEQYEMDRLIRPRAHYTGPQPIH